MIRNTESLTVDLDLVISPISAENPVGADLRYEGIYDAVREARREDDAELTQGIYTSDLKKADWTAVHNLCFDALQTRTKDLQLAAWLLEAWIHLHGFSGITAGLSVVSALCDNFWDGMYPQIEDGNFEMRVAPFEWINEKLALTLKQIPVSQPDSADAGWYSLADWESACFLENLAARDPKAAQQAEAKGKPTLSKFRSSAMLTTTPFYTSIYKELAASVEIVTELDEFLDAKCGRQAPGLTLFKECLISLQQLVVDILRGRHDQVPVTVEDAVGVDEMDWSTGPIRSRAEAYRRLSEAAEYLLRTEPHSPAPYLVKRAVAWGSMSLYELFSQIIRSDSELQELNRLLHMADDSNR